MKSRQRYVCDNIQSPLSGVNSILPSGVQAERIPEWVKAEESTKARGDAHPCREGMGLTTKPFLIESRVLVTRMNIT